LQVSLADASSTIVIDWIEYTHIIINRKEI
jgi:hypothetical protein